MRPADMLAHLGSDIGALMFVGSAISHYLPHQFGSYISAYFQRLVLFTTPYIQITFDELTGERLMCSEAYSAVENYLSIRYSKEAKRIKADINNNSLNLSMDEYEVVVDEFEGARVWWISVSGAKKDTHSSYYKLCFHKKASGSHNWAIPEPCLKGIAKFEESTTKALYQHGVTLEPCRISEPSNISDTSHGAREGGGNYPRLKCI